MKFGSPQVELDPTDRSILELLQRNCKQPLAAIGEKVGLSAPAVVERIHKLEEAGVVLGYSAQLDARLLGKDVTAFIGVSTDRPRAISDLESQMSAIDEVLECHHVTGLHTLMIKLKTRDTQSLEALIERIRSVSGVTRTETMVVLSTGTERTRIALAQGGDARKPRTRSPRRAATRARKVAP